MLDWRAPGDGTTGAGGGGGAGAASGGSNPQDTAVIRVVAVEVMTALAMEGGTYAAQVWMRKEGRNSLAF